MKKKAAEEGIEIGPEIVKFVFDHIKNGVSPTDAYLGLCFATGELIARVDADLAAEFLDDVRINVTTAVLYAKDAAIESMAGEEPETEEPPPAGARH